MTPMEAKIHTAVKILVQEIADKHGVRINSVDIRWCDVSRIDVPAHKVVEVTLNTTTDDHE